MKVSSSLINLVVKSMTESMNSDIMTILAQKLLPDYNLHQRTGFPKSISIPNRDAARQIVNDMKHYDVFPHFVNLLIDINYIGHMGRKYQVSYLRNIVKGVLDLGYIYDKENRMFIEDSNIRKTLNWGVLRYDEEYVFSFLRLDIVGNSKLVREYPDELIQATYSDLRDIVERAIDMRKGRIWNWEGDGGLVAFYFANKSLLAFTSAMDIVHELFIYNQIACRLKNPLGVRLAIHTGPCEYTDNQEELMKSETIKKTIEIEAKHTRPNTVTISEGIKLKLDHILHGQLQPIQVDKRARHYSYELRWEQ